MSLFYIQYFNFFVTQYIQNLRFYSVNMSSVIHVPSVTIKNSCPSFIRLTRKCYSPNVIIYPIYTTRVCTTPPLINILMTRSKSFFLEISQRSPSLPYFPTPLSDCHTLASFLVLSTEKNVGQ